MFWPTDVYLYPAAHMCTWHPCITSTRYLSVPVVDACVQAANGEAGVWLEQAVRQLHEVEEAGRLLVIEFTTVFEYLTVSGPFEIIGERGGRGELIYRWGPARPAEACCAIHMLRLVFLLLL